MIVGLAPGLQAPMLTGRPSPVIAGDPLLYGTLLEYGLPRRLSGAARMTG